VPPVEPNSQAPVATGAKAVVNTPLVNTRSGPGTDFDVVTVVERGAEYDITGRNDDGSWWLICCIDGAQAWIIGEFVDTDGAVDAVPVAGPGIPAVAVAEPAQGGAATSDQFELISQEQFPEAGLVRAFLYVYAGNDALAGYSLRVRKDGGDLPVSGSSFAGQPAFTWPFQDARQRYQNLKLEFPGIDAAGIWELQLIDSSGNAVGPVATFQLAQNDPQQELYVRYARR
jgi:hypothetical protein